MIIDIKSKLAPSCSPVDVETDTLKAMASKSSMEPSELLGIVLDMSLQEPLDTEGLGVEENLPANIIKEKLEKNNPKIGGVMQENSDRITEDDQLTDRRNFNNPVEDGHSDAGFMDKSLTANLDTLDCLFCETCLIFDCRLHGNRSPEDVNYPKEKQSLRPEEDPKPCGCYCYRLDLSKSSAVEATEKGSNWTLFEKEMYWKGTEIFGRNSCNIVRNLLAGLKTCREVANYMNGDGAEVPHSSGGKLGEDHMEPILPGSSGPIQTNGSRGRKPSLGKIVNVEDGTSC